MAEAYIIDACRTPRGTGKSDKSKLASLHPQQLAATVLRALAKRTKIDTADIDDVIWSVGIPLGKQSKNLGRMAAMDAGYNIGVSGVTLARACGGGITTVNFATASIMAGMEHLIVAGGSEMMSYTNTLPPDTLGIGCGNPSLRHHHPQPHQGVAADAIAAMEGIDREALDRLAVESQRRAAIAIQEGWFEKSIVPISAEDGTVLLAQDEHPRPQTTYESLAGLRPAFEEAADSPGGPDGTTNRELINEVYRDLQWTGAHHAGTSSGVVDGAAALLIASGDYIEKHRLKPRARIVSYVNHGDCPTLMLNGPVPAAKKLLEKVGLTKDKIDLWEVNEAFAVVLEKFIRDLDIDRDKINVNGGALALGHPIGATGSILIGTLLDELERRDLKRGVVTMCAAGGMAPAILIERA
ncbi:acetyl-CoA C-acyltransferase [Sphingobium sp. SCG-1]|uniref:acetyl-CoA C-acetyltransferase n=1 Tax=Sphingobium sp. SCG-1 TaxID=2072936 RepID=UPI000CD6AF02|nr:acetyl-CoA C-acetyltransferase [Sphingobium sp. SCG-1]AUW57140.1 acetyl-CoA C-acyltransferase [Sphingobium sp. SCG-1]